MREIWKIFGKVASNGFAEGYAVILPEFESLIPAYNLNNDDEKKKELQKFYESLNQTLNKIKKIQSQVEDSIQELLNIQICFLKDPIFLEEVEKHIHSGKNLAQAIFLSSKIMHTMFFEKSNSSL